VGLKSSYSQITYSFINIGWDTFPFNSFQNIGTGSNSNLTESKSFNIPQNAQSALLFLGVGSHMRSLTIGVSTANGSASNPNIYTTTMIPFDLNLTSYDSSHVFTYSNGTLKQGNYILTITVQPGVGYESGDLYTNDFTQNIFPVPYGDVGDADIYSGTRIAIIYPLLNSTWSSNGFSSNPTTAQQNAYNNLLPILNLSTGGNYDSSQIKTEAIYAGDVPNAIPVRLELWDQ
jgi:hypothetical protein